MTQRLASVLPIFRRILLAIGAVLIAPVCFADGVTVSELSVGLGGIGRVGNWVPVKIAAGGVEANKSVQLVVTASDSRGDECRNVVASGTVDSSGKISLAGVFPPGRLDGSVLVELTDEALVPIWSHSLKINANGEVSNSAESLQTTLRLLRHQPVTVLTVGAMPGLSELVEAYDAKDNSRGTLVTLVAPSFESLPTMRRGYDAVDLMVLNSEYGLSAEQTTAVQQWVMTGGHLIVSSGEKLPSLLSSAPGPWLQSQFGIQTDLIRSQDLSSLQNYVVGANQLQTNRKDVSIVRVTSKESETIVGSIVGPLVSRNTVGAGLITFVSVDLNQEPVRNWLSLPLLYEMLVFGRISSNSETQFGQRQMISSTGVSDLATQLAAVSDAVPEEERWSSWQAMLMMLVFLAIVGPLDYLVVVKLLNRPRMTWVTFPIVVLLGCGLTWWKSDNGRPAETVRAVHLLDIGQVQSSQFARSRSWLSLSTRDSRFAKVAHQQASVFAAAELKSADECFTWHGRAEDVYGGLYRPGGSGLGRVTSRRVELETPSFESVPLLADGSYSFLAESVDEAPTGSLVDVKLKIGSGGLLEGSFAHHLKRPIRNWIVAFGSRVYTPSPKGGVEAVELKPGEEWTRESAKVRITEIRDYLKGVRAVERVGTRKNSTESAMTQVQTPYDTNSRDPQDILTMISLYQVAGGESYAKLGNHALRRDEVSDSIPLTTALLIGVIDEPLCDLVVDDKPVQATKSQTVVRILLPVSRAD